MSARHKKKAHKQSRKQSYKYNTPKHFFSSTIIAICNRPFLYINSGLTVIALEYKFRNQKYFVFAEFVQDFQSEKCFIQQLETQYTSIQFPFLCSREACPNYAYIDKNVYVFDGLTCHYTSVGQATPMMCHRCS